MEQYLDGFEYRMNPMSKFQVKKLRPLSGLMATAKLVYPFELRHVTCRISEIVIDQLSRYTTESKAYKSVGSPHYRFLFKIANAVLVE